MYKRENNVFVQEAYHLLLINEFFFLEYKINAKEASKNTKTFCLQKS